MKEKELKSCPFCGSRHIRICNYLIGKDEVVEQKWYIRCNRCGGRSGEHQSAEEARKSWNERQEAKRCVAWENDLGI